MFSVISPSPLIYCQKLPLVLTDHLEFRSCNVTYERFLGLDYLTFCFLTFILSIKPMGIGLPGSAIGFLCVTNVTIYTLE